MNTAKKKNHSTLDIRSVKSVVRLFCELCSLDIADNQSSCVTLKG